MQVELFEPDEEIAAEIREFGSQKLKDAIQTIDKLEREDNIDTVKEQILEKFLEKYPDEQETIEEVIASIEKDEVRKMITIDGVRPDNRKLDEIRPIHCEVGVPKGPMVPVYLQGTDTGIIHCYIRALGDVQILDGLTKKSPNDICIIIIFLPIVLATRPLRGPEEEKLVTEHWLKERLNLLFLQKKSFLIQ